MLFYKKKAERLYENRDKFRVKKIKAQAELGYFLLMWPYVTHFTSLGLSFIVCKAVGMN
jgi:hypothetical protein